MGETMNVVGADYDRDADVLYLTVGDKGEPSEFQDTPYGVTIRYATSDMQPIGAIVVGYDQYGWARDVERLARVVGELMSLPAGAVNEAIADLHSR